MRRDLRLSLLVGVLLFLAPPSWAGHINGLTIPVKMGNMDLGEIRLHVGTTDFGPNSDQGIGKATADGEQSGFYVAGGMTLADLAKKTGEHHFNWLQIVTMQPPGHEPIFGKVPHADPSNDPNNTIKRDNFPWYLNEGANGMPPDPAINPPFDLPPLTDMFLPFQDFPGGLELGDMIAFDTYLVSINADCTYDILAAFTWKITREEDPDTDPADIVRNHVVKLESISTILPKEYQDIVANYNPDKKFTLVPEPSSFMLLGIGAGCMGWFGLRGRKAPPKQLAA